MYNRKVPGKIIGNVLGRTTKRREFNNKEALDMEVRKLEEYAKCIGIECKKWKSTHPEAIFRHGYADEKARRIIASLERGKELSR